MPISTLIVLIVLIFVFCVFQMNLVEESEGNMTDQRLMTMINYVSYNDL